MRADCMVSNKANAVLQYCALFLYLLYEIVISHLSKMFLSYLCGRVHKQPQFNLSAEIKETKCQIYEGKHFHFKHFFVNLILLAFIRLSDVVMCFPNKESDLKSREASY